MKYKLKKMCMNDFEIKTILNNLIYAVLFENVKLDLI